jgi:hypothetical protein
MRQGSLITTTLMAKSMRVSEFLQIRFSESGKSFHAKAQRTEKPKAQRKQLVLLCAFA